MWTGEIWYASGAEHWHGILSDMLWFAESYEPSAYFANFDAIAENQHMSYGTNNEKHDTLSSWYANGTLKLRGFFFGEINSELQFLLMSVHSPTQVIGYGVRDGQLYRFEEYTDGDYEVLSAACPSVPDAVRFRSLAPFSAMLYLPEPHPGVPPSAALVTVLTSRRSAEPAAGMEQSCRLVTRIRGSILLADKNALINSLRHEDTPMHFYTKLEDFPGYIGAGPRKRWISPSPAVRADH